MTLANAHFVDCDISGGTSGSDSWTSTGQSRTTAFPQDYAHLNGETIKVVKDGVVQTDQTVAAGVVTGSPDHAGLGYTTTIKPSKLDIEGMGLILTKKITKAIVSFYRTLKGKVGTSTSTMETISFDTELFDGIKEVPLNGGYEREGDIIIQQDEPLPMTCRGIILDLGVHNP